MASTKVRKKTAARQGDSAVCSRCGASRPYKPNGKTTTPLPSKWKDFSGIIVCNECIEKHYYLRAVEFPVDCVVEGGTWQEFCQDLQERWAAATTLANWAVTELYARDFRRTPDMPKMPEMPEVYLYGDFCRRNSAGTHTHHLYAHWIGTTVSAQKIFSWVERCYKPTRFDLLWIGKRSLASHRYPVPFPVPSTNWSATTGASGEPLVTFTLGNKKRYTLRLRRGTEFARQLAAFRHIADGTAVPGPLEIYRQRAGGGNARTIDGKTEAGAKASFLVMCKMVVRIPRGERAPATETLCVSTDPNAFWVVEVTGQGKVPIHNADHLRNWERRVKWVQEMIERHAARRQHIAEDLKFETRNSSRRKWTLQALERFCEKQNDRLDSFLKEAAAWLTNYAIRRRVASVVYVDACKDYLPTFPWFRLRLAVKSALEGKGIEFDKSKIKED